MIEEHPKWREPRLYSGYAKHLKQVYEHEPIVQVSLQLILSVFAVSFFAFFAIRPTLSTITTLMKKIEDQEKVSVQLDKKIVQLTQAQDELTAHAADLWRVEKAIPKKPEVDRLSAIIEQIANENNIEIGSIQYQQFPLTNVEQREVDKTIKTTPSRAVGQMAAERFVTFSIAISGLLPDLEAFAAELQKIDRIVTVTQMAFAKNKVTSQQIYPLALTIKLTAYYLP